MAGRSEAITWERTGYPDPEDRRCAHCHRKLTLDETTVFSGHPKFLLCREHAHLIGRYSRAG